MESEKVKKKCIQILDSSLYPFPQELNELDWKEDLSPNNENIKKHISAFANFPGGGFIVFGVSDQGLINGISDHMAKKISQTMGNLARDGVDPKIKTEFFSFEFKNKNLFACYIFESEEKPVYVKKNGKIEAAYIRAGGSSRSMERQEMKRLILNSKPYRFEELPASLGIEKWEEQFDFSMVLQRLKRKEFSSKETLFEFLLGQKLLVKKSGEILPTNLSVITCAKNFSDLSGFERFGIRLLVFKGKNKLNAIRDEFYKKGYSLALDILIEDILNFLPHNEIIEKATRITVSVIPEIAVRELISNAIIHRDYTKNDSYTLVEIFEDRLEVTNPGCLLPEIEVDRIIDHPSRTRNEVLADFMRRLGFAEERGTGIDKVVEACEFYGLPPLKFINGRDYFKAVIYLPKNYADMEKEERVNAVYQHACLNYVMSRKTTNESLRERFKFSSKERVKITRLINEAIALKKIKLANPKAVRKEYHYYPYWA